MKYLFYKAYRSHLFKNESQIFLLLLNYQSDMEIPDNMCLAFFEENEDEEAHINTISIEYILNYCAPIEDKSEYLHLIDELNLYVGSNTKLYIAL